MKHHLLVLTLAVALATLIAALRTGGAAASVPSPVSVPQFEYCQYFGNYYPSALLDKMGHEGWELVSLNTIGEQQVQDRWQPRGFALTFKRQLGSGLKSCDDSEK